MPPSRARRVVPWLITMALGAVAGALSRVALVASSGRIVDPAAAPTRPAAIVFGAGICANGRLSYVLRDRLDTALALYRAGRCRKLLVSGDHGRRGYDEPGAMAAYLEQNGVPAKDVFLDHAGFDTYASLYRARDVFAVRSALLVTQEFHLPRALYLADRLGVQAVGVRADRRTYSARHRFMARELGASVKAVLWAELLKPGPRYLGAQVPIDGDGRVTTRD